MIYFIVADGWPDMVKIGYTDLPIRIRISSLQTGCPGTISLVAGLIGAKSEEVALHQRFSHNRVRGEWFRIDEEIAEFISEHAMTPASFDATDQEYQDMMRLKKERLDNFTNFMSLSKVEREMVAWRDYIKTNKGSHIVNELVNAPNKKQAERRWGNLMRRGVQPWVDIVLGDYIKQMQ